MRATTFKGKLHNQFNLSWTKYYAVTRISYSTAHNCSNPSPALLSTFSRELLRHLGLMPEGFQTHPRVGTDTWNHALTGATCIFPPGLNRKISSFRCNEMQSLAVNLLLRLDTLKKLSRKNGTPNPNEFSNWKGAQYYLGNQKKKNCVGYWKAYK